MGENLCLPSLLWHTVQLPTATGPCTNLALPMPLWHLSVTHESGAAYATRPGLDNARQIRKTDKKNSKTKTTFPSLVIPLLFIETPPIAYLKKFYIYNCAVKTTHCLIKNLYERESLPHIRNLYGRNSHIRSQAVTLPSYAVRTV